MAFVVYSNYNFIYLLIYLIELGCYAENLFQSLNRELNKGQERKHLMLYLVFIYYVFLSKKIIAFGL